VGPNGLWPTQPKFWVGPGQPGGAVGPGPPGLPCHGTMLTMGSGRRCKLSQRGPGWSPDRSRILLYRMLSKRIWLQHFSLFGQHCNEGHNESQSRLRSNLVSAGNLRHINIIHSLSNWQVNRQLLFTIKWQKKKRKENLTDLN